MDVLLTEYSEDSCINPYSSKSNIEECLISKRDFQVRMRSTHTCVLLVCTVLCVHFYMLVYCLCTFLCTYIYCLCSLLVFTVCVYFSACRCTDNLYCLHQLYWSMFTEINVGMICSASWYSCLTLISNPCMDVLYGEGGEKYLGPNLPRPISVSPQ